MQAAHCASTSKRENLAGASPIAFQIRARGLGDDVVTHWVVVIAASGYIHFELNGDSARHKPDNAVVLLSGNIDLGVTTGLLRSHAFMRLLKRHIGGYGTVAAAT